MILGPNTIDMPLPYPFLLPRDPAALAEDAAMPNPMSKLLLPPPSHASFCHSSPRYRPCRTKPASQCSARCANGWPLHLWSGSRFAACAVSKTGLVVNLSPEILRTELGLLEDDALTASPNFPLNDVKHRSLLAGETPAYPAAIKALYAACLAGNVTEQLWNFTWPAAIATLHPSFVPVAVLGFFTKLVVFAAGPLVGDLISSLPRIPTYRSLTLIQTAAHLVSAAAFTYAFALPLAPSTAVALLLQPWFAALVVCTAVDRLSCVCLSIIVERDFVVQLAGARRPVALARANATLGRVDLLCETAGASVFAVLLSRNAPLTCIKLSCAISLCRLPLLIFLAGEMNRLADGVFYHSSSSHEHGRAASAFSLRQTIGEAFGTIRRGWIEYLRQPVLPASLAYVLLCFNVALAPGALMTTFLVHRGVSSSVLGAFGGSSAAVGILATFLAPYLVKELGILKAGAAGLITQSAVLGAAVLVFYLAGGGPASRHQGGGGLFAFLGLIVASRLGHVAYSVIGLQVVQTGNPTGKAKLIGATEVAVASLAELAMMAVAAVVARDSAHFGLLAALSAAAVAAAACLFCAWMAKPSEELGRLFPR